MDAVETHAFSMTKKEYFLILIMNYLRSRWWVYIVMFILIGLVFLLRPEAAFFFVTIAAGAVAVLLPAAQVLYYWWIVSSKENASLYEDRRMAFDENWLRVHMSDGTKSELPWDRVSKARELRSNILLYISRHQFFFVDVAAFRSDHDLEAFHQILESHGLAVH